MRPKKAEVGEGERNGDDSGSFSASVSTRVHLKAGLLSAFKPTCATDSIMRMNALQIGLSFPISSLCGRVVLQEQPEYFSLGYFSLVYFTVFAWIILFAPCPPPVPATCAKSTMTLNHGQEQLLLWCPCPTNEKENARPDSRNRNM